MFLVREGKYLPAAHESLEPVPGHVRDGISYTIKYDYCLVNWIPPDTQATYRKHNSPSGKTRREGGGNWMGKRGDNTLNGQETPKLRERIKV